MGPPFELLGTYVTPSYGLIHTAEGNKIKVNFRYVFIFYLGLPRYHETVINTLREITHDYSAHISGRINSESLRVNSRHICIANVRGLNPE
jgi:hypothetical protein